MWPVDLAYKRFLAEPPCRALFKNHIPQWLFSLLLLSQNFGIVIRMNLIETLESLEPVFVEAAKLALKMQIGVSSHNKTNTGDNLFDIVTDADLAVQEFLLEKISETDLINCHLLAEEDTLSVNKFNLHGEYYLAIDPIDGTATYSKGGKCFSTIITLHDGKNILYMFDYFPALNYGHKTVDSKYSTYGVLPDFVLLPEVKQTIIYWSSGNPEKNIPELYSELKNKGISFTKLANFGPDANPTTMFYEGKIAGLYHENMNVYDGLAHLSVAQAKGSKIYSGGQNGSLDLRNIQKRETGLYYPGWYLVLNTLSFST